MQQIPSEAQHLVLKAMTRGEKKRNGSQMSKMSQNY